MKKQIISAVLVLCILLAFVPMKVFANDGFLYNQTELPETIPEYPIQGQRYWIIFNEGFRSNRLEMSTFDISGDATDIKIIWNRSLKAASSTGTVSRSNQFVYTPQEWAQIGTYGILSDKATKVFASNVNVYDGSGNLIVAADDSLFGFGHEVEFKGHHYKLYNHAKTWEDAKSYCESVGGHLATITSADENAFLYSYIESLGIKNAYFGLSDSEKEGRWQWVTGEPLKYVNWNSGEPNSERSNEDYAMFYYKFTSGTWNDGNYGQGTVGDSNPNFICEWDKEQPAKNKAIVIVPGITGSELWGFVGAEYQKVWIGDGVLHGVFGEMLQCEEDGSSNSAYAITAPVPSDDSDSFGTLGTYTNLVQTLQKAYDADFGGSGEYEVRFFAYDWRLTNTLAAEKLNEFVSDYDQVVFVCHSMGGIVASIYMAEYGTDKVEKLITLGTPYYGSPKAVYAQETGHFLDGFAGKISSGIIKNLIPNMPGVYELIPSENYFKGGNYYISHPMETHGLNYSQTKEIASLSDWYNSTVYENAESVFSKQYAHGSINSVYDKIISGDINSYIIVGYNQKTLTCMEVSGSLLGDMIINDVDVNLTGDGTVPLISSTFNYTKMSRSPYYIDGKDYPFDGEADVNHTGLVTDERVINLVCNILNGNGDSSNYDTGCGGLVSRSISVKKGFTGYKIKTACPVEVTFREQDGTEIGTISSSKVDAADGHGFDFYLCGENNEIKIAFLDYEYADILIRGYDNGTMDFCVERYENGESIESVTYSDVSITPITQIWTNTDISNDSVLDIDNDGDGYCEKTITPDINLPCSDDTNCPGIKFTDMPEKGNWAHDAIDWAIVREITTGTSATKFSPNGPCTRAQIVTFLWRACGEPEPMTSNNPFSDVKSSAYYYKAVLWAVENGITTGTGKGKFSPEDTCTRGQVATFLWRAQGKPAPTSSANPFNDVNSNAYYYNAILWAVENGVTNGTGKGRFSPDEGCTRAQIVTFLYRALT